MSTTDTSRRLRSIYLDQDVDSLRGVGTIADYASGRPETTLKGLQNSYAAMMAAQDEETKTMVRAKAAADKARLAEWQFHDNILAMKELVRGVYGSDSDEAQAIGYKKKSERKRPRRSIKVAAM
ncbi:hypothetical protein IQ254_02265 [Nodosilinea sp. LEGE 07088]|uniref:hypothetical protein n=1 Tax=Nodosilinea sp. LEGE 07088 TaxID=2777968 RepID=UPI00187EF639|nr:hypothetical protein [Nodosilinea sp. LEGE 07088]MBE9136038.1 hypothetical protein [Nodosilinea sp. LEGE 07088]